MLTSSFVTWPERVMSGRVQKRLDRLYSVGDVRDAARRRLPQMIFDFVDGGAEDERTLASNVAAFDLMTFRTRPLVDVGERSWSAELFGVRSRAPFVLAPAGLAGLLAPRGEELAARAAGEWGVPFALSTMSSVSIEDVRRSSEGSLWFQLYLWRDRSATEHLVDRARRSRYDVLCLTVDVPLSGRRERDLRHGMTIPPRVSIRNAIDVARHPRWAIGAARTPITFANVAPEAAAGSGAMALGKFVNSQLNPGANWDDFRWLRERWSGPLVVKGVLDAETAGRLVDEGVDGIVVSNHGGRQLDGAVAAILALGEVVGEVAGRVPVILDGGVRRGTHVLTALALGADAVMLGRPYLWGLAVGGSTGVRHVLDLLEAEIDRSLALIGCADLADIRALGHRIVAPPPVMGSPAAEERIAEVVSLPSVPTQGVQ
jgi:L-lactate dehydrogenase (cytochrome)